MRELGINVVLQQTTIIPDTDSDFLPFSIQGVWKILPDPLICQGFYSFLCSFPNVDERESVCSEDTVRVYTLMRTQ